MCGIVGYIGTKKACPILINGLLKLEYRGYDSSGISTIEDGYISNIKDKGRVKNLYNSEEINELAGTIRYCPYKMGYTWKTLQGKLSSSYG